MAKSFLELIHDARARQAELAAKRAVLQNALHAKLAETMGAEGHPEVIALRAQIVELQREKYDIDQGLSAATKSLPGVRVLKAE
jgi:hypothetical protein